MKQTIGLLLVTLGAILRYAIDTKSGSDVNVPTIGLILMIVGAIAFLTDVALELAKRRATMPVTPPSAPAMIQPTAAPPQPQQSPPPQQSPQAPQHK